jgi:RNA polymerase sigma factor (sigma-70 family)
MHSTEVVNRNIARTGDSSLPAVPGRVVDEEIANWVSRTQRRDTSEMRPALSSWTRQMEKYPQLTPAAQGELVADYQAGIEAEETLKAVKKRGKLEEKRLREAVKAGHRAIEYLTASNFRLVTLIAREKAEERWGKEKAVEVLPDLVGEANIALVEAARAFNPTAGPSFPTYAARVIRDRMLMMLTREHPVRLPPSWNRLKRIASVRTPMLGAELGRPATRAELEADLIATCMRWAYDKLSDDKRKLPKKEREQHQMDRLRKQGMLGAIEHLDEVLLYTQGMTALDAPLGEDGGSLLDLLSDDTPAPGAALEADELKAAVAEVLASLPDRDREIILYRYAFIDGVQWPYQKISELYGVSAERIRQIEKAAIAKLRIPGAGDHLAAFLDTQLQIDD